MKTLAAAIVFCVSLFIGGCSGGANVTTDFDPGENFNSLKTYQWMSDSQNARTPNPQRDVFQNSLVENRFKNAVNSDLEQKGLTQTSNKPDFLVQYYFGTRNRVNVTEYGYNYGPWWAGTQGNVDVRQYTEGTVILDFVDAKTKQLVWRGIASGALPEHPDPAKAQDKINSLVKKMLDDYPPKTK